MKINSLKIKNFKQYEECSISFPEGLTGLVGKNGAGKSTIFEAIYMALYGKYKFNKDKMRNDNAKTNEAVEIELSFQDNYDNYRIKRKFSGSNLTPSAELFINDDNVACSFGSNEVTKKITKLLKIDSKNFKNSFFSEQKEVTALLDMKGNERHVQFRKMLGLQKLDKLEDRIKEKKNETDKELIALQKILLTDAQIEQLRYEEELISNTLKEAKVKEAYISDVLKNLDTLYKDIKLKITVEEDKEKKVNAVIKTIVATEEKIKATQLNIEKNNSKLKERIENSKEFESIIPLKNNYDKAVAQYTELLKQKTIHTNKLNLLKSIQEKYNSLKELEEEVKNLQLIINSFINIESEKDRIRTEYKHNEELKKNKDLLKTEIKKRFDLIESEISKLNINLKKLNKLGINSPCPECKRPLGEEYYSQMLKEYTLKLNRFSNDKTDAEQQLKTVNEEINALEQKMLDIKHEADNLVKLSSDLANKKNNLEEIERRKEKLLNDINAFELEYENYKNITFDENRLTETEKKKNELEPVSKKFFSLQTLVKEIPEYENNLEKEKKLLIELSDKLTELNSERNGIQFNEEFLTEQRKEREIKEKELTKLNNEKTEITLIINNGKNNLKNILSRLEEDDRRRAQKEKIESNIKTLNKLIDFIKEFKVKLTSKELPSISESADKLFTEITKGRYTGLRIEPDFNFYVNRDGIDVPLDTLSGGEKDLASICIRIAISKRIAALSGRKNMGFLALDEVFGSQDQNRREDLVNTLQAVSGDFKQIFVVTHNQDVEEVFPNKLLVQRKGNYSFAELV